MLDIKMIRKEKKITQQQAADLVGISLRSYKSYENDHEKNKSLKYKYILEKLLQFNPIDEEHGILELEDIKRKCRLVFQNYDVSYCYLFGSYSKGKATPTSDIDLLISCDVHGLMFLGMVEELRDSLHKRIDALDFNQLNDNLKLINEILQDGIKIYG